MFRTMKLGNLLLVGAWLAASIPGQLALAAPESQTAYDPLAPLIREWDVGLPGTAPSFSERFSWGPKRAYVWASVSLLNATGEEHVHFEGLII